jgi:anaerobic ribonucleoside-triphosphate reductase activating protein
MIALNKVHFPVTTLGYGRRVGLWLQGCSLRCPGCLSRDTWEARPEHWLPIPRLLEQLTAWLAQADGVTISGGEPFDQPAALLALLSGLRKKHRGDILIYSGYAPRRLWARHKNIMAVFDVLVAGPYRQKAGHTLALRGSDNQCLLRLSALGRRRYPATLDGQPWPTHRRLDAALGGGALWLAGIPRPGDLPRLRAALAARGYLCQTSADGPIPIHA